MKISKFAYCLIPLVGTVLIAQDDLLIGNISGLTVNPVFYGIVLVYCFCMGLTFAKTIKKICNRKWAIVGLIAVVMAIIVPYSFENSLIANLHVLNAYFGFTVFSIVLFKTINNFKIYNYQLAKYLNCFAMLIYLIILFMAMHFMVINGLMEIIYLWMIDIVLGMIELKAN